MEIQIDEETAVVICQMNDVCYGEGIGPDTEDLMNWIWDNYPHLKKRFEWMV